MFQCYRGAGEVNPHYSKQGRMDGPAQAASTASEGSCNSASAPNRVRSTRIRSRPSAKISWTSATCPENAPLLILTLRPRVNTPIAVSGTVHC
jgi:hypothetical protein